MDLKKIKKLKSKNIKVLFHSENRGKGSAIKTAQKFIKGKYTIIQDADLEYIPREYYKLIEPMKYKKVKIVYGSRVKGKKRYKSKNFTSFVRIFFNHLLTIISNIINKQNLTDAHTVIKFLIVLFLKK